MVQRIPLSGQRGTGLFALVDDEDAQLIAGYSWHLRESLTGNQYAYAYVRGSGKARPQHVSMHTVITGQRFVDHADGDGLNNTRLNLRPYAGGQNHANSKPRRGRRYKGAYYDPRRGHWYANITVDRHQRRVGTFPSEEAAARAYDEAALAAWGEFARLNFPR